MMDYKADLVLEMEDLLSYNELTHDIKVDKYAFDDFVENKLVYIHFIEDQEGCIREYKMRREDEDGIEMDYLCEYVD